MNALAGVGLGRTIRYHTRKEFPDKTRGSRFCGYIDSEQYRTPSADEALMPAPLRVCVWYRLMVAVRLVESIDD